MTTATKTEQHVEELDDQQEELYSRRNDNDDK